MDQEPPAEEANPDPDEKPHASLLPDFVHQGTQPLAPAARRQLVASGGTARLENVSYGDAILTDNWPRDGLLLARSTLAEKIVVEKYRVDRMEILEKNKCQQWWPARAIAVEEYLEYYASTPARFRPKVDAVAVVFLNPWWSSEVLDNQGSSRMFELEAVEAKATHARQLPLTYEPPECPQPLKEAVNEAHADARALAAALSNFAATHIPPLEKGDAWPRRAARLKAAFEATKPAPRERRQGPSGDVSTAHLDVACYPPHVLQLPWRAVVDAARSSGQTLDLDRLPEPFAGTFNQQAQEHARRPKTPLELDPPGATKRKRGADAKAPPARAPPDGPADPGRVQAALGAKAATFDEGDFMRALGIPPAAASLATPSPGIAAPALPPQEDRGISARSPPVVQPPTLPAISAALPAIGPPPVSPPKPAAVPKTVRPAPKPEPPAAPAPAVVEAPAPPAPAKARSLSGGGASAFKPPAPAPARKKKAPAPRPELASAPASAPYRSKGKERKPSVSAEAPRFSVGDLVEVAPRTHPGVNFPGGTATIKSINDERITNEPMRDGSERRTTGFTYAVKYVLGGSEKRVDAQHIRKSVAKEGRRASSPRASEEGLLPPKKRRSAETPAAVSVAIAPPPKKKLAPPKPADDVDRRARATARQEAAAAKVAAYETIRADEIARVGIKQASPRPLEARSPPREQPVKSAAPGKKRRERRPREPFEDTVADEFSGLSSSQLREAMQKRGIGRGAYDTPQDFLRKLRTHTKRRDDPFASDSDDALPPKCEKCDGPHVTDDCPHFPKTRDPSPEPGANPFNPWKRKKPEQPDASSSEEEVVEEPVKEEEPEVRREPGRPGKVKEDVKPPLKKRQRSPPKEHEEGEEDLTCRKGCGRVFSHPPARVAHEKSCRGRVDSSRAARARARASSDEMNDEDPPPSSPPPTRASPRRMPRALSPRGGVSIRSPQKDGQKALPEPRRVRVKPEAWAPAADEDQFFDAENFDRWSDRGAPTLQVPITAPVDVGRPLAYLQEGDEPDKCGARASQAARTTKQALKACKGTDASRAAVARELWLYLAARAGRRSSATSCAALAEAAAERDCAAALQDLEVVTLAAAAAGARACARARPPRKMPKPRPSDIGPLTRLTEESDMSEASSSDASEDEGDDVEFKKRLVKARAERAAALDALERVDGLVQGLLDRDDAQLRRRCADAATDRTDRDVVARRAARNRDADARAAAERGAQVSQRALDDARAARREVDVTRDAWLKHRNRTRRRVLAGVARPLSPREDDDAPYAWSVMGAPRTLCVYDRRCRLHSTKPHCVEQARRAVAAAAVVEARARRCHTKLWVERTVHGSYVQRAAASLAYAHTRSYVGAVRQRCADLATEATMIFGGEDEDTCGNRDTWGAALAASAAVIQAVDAVLCGEARNALCAVRPPGHHAGASLNSLGAPGNGYCLLNHAALGAKHAAHERGLKRVAVFDFDVHHGNGTEDILARTFDPRFMYLSLHATGEDVFPGSGRRARPDHPGVLNAPHHAEKVVTTEWVLEEAMPRILAALDAFRPDLLILSSGFDAHKRDPVDLGRLDASDYGVLTRRLVDWAERKCCGRLVSVLEGGYGVDCGPGGEYVTSGRREAFDTCLRAHLDELANTFVDAEVDEEADLRQEADSLRAADAAAHAAAKNAVRTHKAAADAFFRDPPADGDDAPAADGGLRLTASALSGLGRAGDDEGRVDMLLSKE